MNRMRFMQIVAAFLLLPCATGCVVNRAISASAVADNLAVERAQNEMLLLNVLRGKDHRPMYISGISKITGSIKAEASLGGTVPLGSVQGDRSLGTVASPSATYNWNPNYDVNVLDTHEFMRGFMTPINADIFAYYWNEGFFPEFLMHLMVQKIEVRVKRGVCDGQEPESGVRRVDEYTLLNNHEMGNEPVELERFADWTSEFLGRNPHFAEGKAESLGPPLTPEQASRALIRGLQQGLTLAPMGKKFQFQRVGPPPMVLKLDGEQDLLQDLYFWTSDTLREDLVVFHPHYEAYNPETDSEGCPTQPGQTEGGDATSVAAPPIKSRAPEGRLTASGLIWPEDDPNLARMTITFFLRSPEAMLYYLGELARFEETSRQVLYICMHDHLEPMFVVRRDGDCGPRAVVATTGEGLTYFIPSSSGIEGADLCGPKKYDLRSASASCDSGRSLHALTVVAQLLALQKSAKDLPTTSVVRVVGQ